MTGDEGRVLKRKPKREEWTKDEKTREKTKETVTIKGFILRRREEVNSVREAPVFIEELNWSKTYTY